MNFLKSMVREVKSSVNTFASDVAGALADLELLPDPQWTKLNFPGMFKKIVCANRDCIFALSADNKVFHYLSTNQWVQLPGDAADISCGEDRDLWAVHFPSGAIFRWTGGENWTGGAWTQIPSPPAAKISVANTNQVVMATAQGAVFLWRGPAGFQQVPGVVSDIGITPDGTLRAINPQGQIFECKPPQQWSPIMGCQLREIEISRKGTVGITPAGEIMRYLGNSHWQKLKSLPAISASIGHDGELVYISSTGDAYRNGGVGNALTAGAPEVTLGLPMGYNGSCTHCHALITGNFYHCDMCPTTLCTRCWPLANHTLQCPGHSFRQYTTGAAAIQVMPTTMAMMPVTPAGMMNAPVPAPMPGPTGMSFSISTSSSMQGGSVNISTTGMPPM